MKFLAQVAELQFMGVDDLPSAYIYFKYIVRGKITEETSLGFMMDWEKIQNRHTDPNFMSPQVAEQIKDFKFNRNMVKPDVNWPQNYFMQVNDVLALEFSVNSGKKSATQDVMNKIEKKESLLATLKSLSPELYSRALYEANQAAIIQGTLQSKRDIELHAKRQQLVNTIAEINAQNDLAAHLDTKYQNAQLLATNDSEKKELADVVLGLKGNVAQQVLDLESRRDRIMKELAAATGNLDYEAEQKRILKQAEIAAKAQDKKNVMYRYLTSERGDMEAAAAFDAYLREAGQPDLMSSKEGHVVDHGYQAFVLMNQAKEGITNSAAGATSQLASLEAWYDNRKKFMSFAGKSLSREDEDYYQDTKFALDHIQQEDQLTSKAREIRNNISLMPSQSATDIGRIYHEQEAAQNAETEAQRLKLERSMGRKGSATEKAARTLQIQQQIKELKDTHKVQLAKIAQDAIRKSINAYIRDFGAEKTASEARGEYQRMEEVAKASAYQKLLGIFANRGDFTYDIYEKLADVPYVLNDIPATNEDLMKKLKEGVKARSPYLERFLSELPKDVWDPAFREYRIAALDAERQRKTLELSNTIKDLRQESKDLLVSNAEGADTQSWMDSMKAIGLEAYKSMLSLKDPAVHSLMLAVGAPPESAFLSSEDPYWKQIPFDEFPTLTNIFKDMGSKLDAANKAHKIHKLRKGMDSVEAEAKNLLGLENFQQRYEKLQLQANLKQSINLALDPSQEETYQKEYNAAVLQLRRKALNDYVESTVAAQQKILDDPMSTTDHKKAALLEINRLKMFKKHSTDSDLDSGLYPADYALDGFGVFAKALASDDDVVLDKNYQRELEQVVNAAHKESLDSLKAQGDTARYNKDYGTAIRLSDEYWEEEMEKLLERGKKPGDPEIFEVLAKHEKANKELKKEAWKYENDQLQQQVRNKEILTDDQVDKYWERQFFLDHPTWTDPVTMTPEEFAKFQKGQQQYLTYAKRQKALNNYRRALVAGQLGYLNAKQEADYLKTNNQQRDANAELDLLDYEGTQKLVDSMYNMDSIKSEQFDADVDKLKLATDNAKDKRVVDVGEYNTNLKAASWKAAADNKLSQISANVLKTKTPTPENLQQAKWATMVNKLKPVLSKIPRELNDQGAAFWQNNGLLENMDMLNNMGSAQAFVDAIQRATDAATDVSTNTSNAAAKAQFKADVANAIKATKDSWDEADKKWAINQVNAEAAQEKARLDAARNDAKVKLDSLNNELAAIKVKFANAKANSPEAVQLKHAEFMYKAAELDYKYYDAKINLDQLGVEQAINDYLHDNGLETDDSYISKQSDINNKAQQYNSQIEAYKRDAVTEASKKHREDHVQRVHEWYKTELEMNDELWSKQSDYDKKLETYYQKAIGLVNGPVTEKTAQEFEALKLQFAQFKQNQEVKWAVSAELVNEFQEAQKLFGEVAVGADGKNYGNTKVTLANLADTITSKLNRFDQLDKELDAPEPINQAKLAQTKSLYTQRAYFMGQFHDYFNNRAGLDDAQKLAFLGLMMQNYNTINQSYPDLPDYTPPITELVPPAAFDAFSSDVALLFSKAALDQERLDKARKDFLHKLQQKNAVYPPDIAQTPEQMELETDRFVAREIIKSVKAQLPGKVLSTDAVKSVWNYLAGDALKDNKAFESDRELQVEIGQWIEELYSTVYNQKLDREISYHQGLAQTNFMDSKLQKYQQSLVDKLTTEKKKLQQHINEDLYGENSRLVYVPENLSQQLQRDLRRVTDELNQVLSGPPAPKNYARDMVTLNNIKNTLKVLHPNLDRDSASAATMQMNRIDEVIDRYKLGAQVQAQKDQKAYMQTSGLDDLFAHKNKENQLQTQQQIAAAGPGPGPLYPPPPGAGPIALPAPAPAPAPAPTPAPTSSTMDYESEEVLAQGTAPSAPPAPTVNVNVLAPQSLAVQVGTGFGASGTVARATTTAPAPAPAPTNPFAPLPMNRLPPPRRTNIRQSKRSRNLIQDEEPDE
jgi:hypothetical protein